MLHCSLNELSRQKVSLSCSFDFFDSFIVELRSSNVVMAVAAKEFMMQCETVVLKEDDDVPKQVHGGVCSHKHSVPRSWKGPAMFFNTRRQMIASIESDVLCFCCYPEHESPSLPFRYLETLAPNTRMG